MEKNISLFIQDRLKKDVDQAELLRFFKTIFEHMEDVDFDRVAMNLNGNYAISFLIANACKYINDKLSLQ